MEEKVILKEGRYTLIDRGHEYVVACGYNENNPQGSKWDHGIYFTTTNKKEKAKMLAAATDTLCSMLYKNYISKIRLEELTTISLHALKEEELLEIYEYEEDLCLEENEREFFEV